MLSRALVFGRSGATVGGEISSSGRGRLLALPPGPAGRFEAIDAFIPVP